MSKNLYFSFTTFPFKEELNFISNNVFYFHKINSELPEFFKLIIELQPENIIGLAYRRNSRIEFKAVNQFTRNKTINKKGKEFYNLHIDKSLSNKIKIARNTTNSFCNLTTYLISEFLEKENLDINLSFIHVSNKDILLHCKEH